MKKLLIGALTLALALSMSISAFATVKTDGGTQDIDVKAKFVDSSASSTVYHVDVAWGAMEFTYTVSGAKTWNPATHQYTVSTTGGWTATGNEITVTNHSNTAVKADFTYKAQTEYEAVTGSFSQSSLTLPTAEDKSIDDAMLIGKTELTLGGVLSDDKTALAKVGVITVTISKA